LKMKKLILATVLLAASTAANAGLVSGAGNVDWNTADVNSTANGGNFFTPLSFRQWFVDSNGDAASLYDTGSLNTNIVELVGIGELSLGNNMGQPLPGGYELTFEFGGIGVNTTTGLLDPTSNGFLNIYLDKDFSDNAGGYDNTAAVVGDVLNSNQFNDATDGELWLGLNFASGTYTPAADSASLPPAFQNLGIWGNNSFAGLIGGDANFGFQINDAAPGIAQNNFESNWTTYIGAAVDAIGFGLSSKFNVIYDENAQGDYTGISAIATYSGSSAGTVEAFTVTEPTSIAIFGLGLLGFAAASRRKKS
jgi:hypothetical protein